MKRIMSAVFALSLVVSLSAACTPAAGDGDHITVYGFELKNDEYVMSNEHLSLVFYPETTFFTVTDKRTGEVWHSNPEDGAADPLADSMTRRIAQSLLVLEYSKGDGVTTLLDSFNFSVSRGNYSYTIHEDGLGFDVHFTLGNIARTYYIPNALPAWRMEEITENFDDKDLRKLTNELYRIIDIERLRNETLEELLLLYPDIEEVGRVYAMRDIAPFLKQEAEDLFESYGYTPEQYYEDLLFYETERVETEPAFNVTLRVELDGKRLRVSVPFDEIDYPLSSPPVSLRLLPFFGAAGQEDEGYILVPDGSGALINFNNGKENQSPYINSVYGWDVAQVREAVVNEHMAYFPVFGIEKNGNALLCVIDEGASYASVRAAVSKMPGMTGSHNIAYNDYTLINREVMNISTKSMTSVLLFQKELPAGETLTQYYYFCEKDGYIGMAETYREYLTEKYPHLEKKQESAVPVAVEITGAVNRVQHIVGFPVDQPFKLTTYKEATDIVNDLEARGVTDVNYRLTGWFNHSTDHDVPSKVKLISQLGSKKDLTGLSNAISDNGSQLFMEADFMHMRNNKIGNGFSLNRDAARYINRKRVEIYRYSFVWFGERDGGYATQMGYLARPAYTMDLIDGFISQIAAYGTDNVAFRSIGNTLGGDYNEKKLVTREASILMQTEKLQEMYDNSNGIMIQGGFSYAAPYADFITDIPLLSQGFNILDNAIPFYQIVLHGLVDYAGRPMNHSEDYKMNLLRSLESGAGLYFTFMHESPSVLQHSRYLSYYSNEYAIWADDTQELYEEFSSQVGDIYNMYITDYRILADGVSVTEYENGVQVVVNKSSAPYPYEGQTVPAKDYIVRRDN